MALLTACGGESGGNNAGGTPPTAGTPPPPPPANAACSTLDRQQWAEAQIDEWYLFPETLPANRDPSGFATVRDYIDSLTATARSQGRDRFFTFITSITEENAFFQSGSNAGFGIRISYDDAGQRLFISEAFEGAPALAAGVDRGTEILAIGTSASDLRTISEIVAAGGPSAITDALGPSSAGIQRTLRVEDAANGTRNVSITKADYDLEPVSSRYGAQVIADGGREVGYLNLRTFIETADPALEAAFNDFKARGITEFIIDFRYNGGGLVSTAELFGDLLAQSRMSDVFSRLTYRASKSQFNSVKRFEVKTQSVAPTRIAFIGTGSTASASELVINAFIPFLGSDLALIGSDTFGKPVGQVGLDRDQCDDRLRVVAFATENSAGNADYFSGLANSVDVSCAAGDDVSFPLGDPRENSVARALDFLAGRSCQAIAGAPGGGAIAAQNTPTAQSSSASVTSPLAAQPTAQRTLLMPSRPTAAQINSPGIF
ncbi:S41 family peptidase [Parasphingopyxis sp. CP4]|uniref:S41 family peptidase n=1 Tax=Parasphingopyxis sp. CP4 TaxID=2724527 RepID=UPI0021021FAB|nr:S41 family peptidase [Parasphingopyxis sp. CP4]